MRAGAFFRARRTAVDHAGQGPVIGIGFSKGAEALLALSQRRDTFDRLIAVAPSSHAWESVRMAPDAPPESAWTWDDRPLPYAQVPIDPEFYRDFDQRRLHSAHQRALTTDQGDARIELPPGLPTLLISSENNETWPASQMAAQLATDRANATHVELPQAGHLVLPPGHPATRAGGTPEANGRADRTMWSQIRAFLEVT